MLCRTSFLQKSEKRFWRKQEFLIVNRSSSITFSIIMYLPGILSAYMLHFPTQKLESNLRDSVNLITNPTSSVMKCCERDVRYDHWYFTVSDWVRILHLYDDKITKMPLETQECWSLLSQEWVVIDVCFFCAHEAKWKEMGLEKYLRLYNKLNNTRYIMGWYLWSISVPTSNWRQQKNILFFSKTTHNFINFCDI